MKHFAVALMTLVALTACKDPAAGVGGGTFSSSEEFSAGLERASLTSLVSNAFFKTGSGTSSNTDGTIKATLYIYVHTLPTTSQLMKVQMLGSDGSSWIIAVTGSPTAPGWFSVDMDLKSDLTGTVTYTIWLVMDDFSTSNKLTTSFNFSAQPGVGSTTEISGLVFDPEPTVAKTSSEAVTENVSFVTVKVSFFIKSVTPGETIVSLRLTGTDGTDEIFPITTPPSVPGWFSQDVTFRYNEVEGHFDFTAWLILDDYTESNKLTDILTILSDKEEGSSTIISRPNFDPTTADSVYETINTVDTIVSYKSTLNFYINTLKTGPKVMLVRLTGTDGTNKSLSVKSDPTVPGWYSTTVTWDVTEKPATGSYTYTVWLEMSDLTVSNKPTTTLSWP
ncbi:hypothetical protein MNBD_NITROSPINAE04-455 [hydrothermal vent metagenome]|uniref:Uncharacterized protein n=1 Tax=hydrothermal vent metagenome TaxID=652676 RepID=A0A3B1CK67_9ZZZZ